MDAQTKQIEVGAGTRGSLNKLGENKTDCFSRSKGCRAKGGGRTDHLKAYKLMVKSWVEDERANGHSINATDLQLQWVWFADEARKKLEARKEELKPDGKFPGSSIGTRGNHKNWCRAPTDRHFRLRIRIHASRCAFTSKSEL